MVPDAIQLVGDVQWPVAGVECEVVRHAQRPRVHEEGCAGGDDARIGVPRGELSGEGVARQVAEAVVAQRAKGIVGASVQATRNEIVRDPGFMRRA